MTTKQILVPVLAIVAGGAIVLTSVSYVQAQDTYPPIVERLAEKFNLNRDEVQGVFDQTRDEHHQLMRQNWEQKLNDAVQQGTITSDQQSAILAKLDQKHQLHEQLGDMTPEERQQRAQQYRQEFENWLTENQLTSEILQQIGIGHFGVGMGPAGKGFKSGFLHTRMMGSPQ